MPVVEALEGCLKVLEEEILRLTKLASESTDLANQENYWRLAQDLQRAARETRLQIKRICDPATALNS
jgi:hypothetical protein